MFSLFIMTMFSLTLHNHDVFTLHNDDPYCCIIANMSMIIKYWSLLWHLGLFVCSLKRTWGIWSHHILWFVFPVPWACCWRRLFYKSPSPTTALGQSLSNTLPHCSTETVVIFLPWSVPRAGLRGRVQPMKAVSGVSTWLTSLGTCPRP